MIREINFHLEIKKDYMQYLKNKKLRNIIIQEMRKFAIHTSFYMSSRKAIQKMLLYNEELQEIDRKIAEFEHIMSKFSYDDEIMIQDIVELSLDELSQIHGVSHRTIIRWESQLDKKYRWWKYGKIDK